MRANDSSYRKTSIGFLLFRWKWKKSPKNRKSAIFGALCNFITKFIFRSLSRRVLHVLRVFLKHRKMDYLLQPVYFIGNNIMYFYNSMNPANLSGKFWIFVKIKIEFFGQKSHFLTIIAFWRFFVKNVFRCNRCDSDRTTRRVTTFHPIPCQIWQNCRF
jgi:hypothetical protein